MRFISFTVTPAAPYYLILDSPDSAYRPETLRDPLIGVMPGGGGSVVVSMQIVPGGAWWPVADGNLAGTLTDDVYDVLATRPYAVRFTATTADAAIEVAQ